MAEESDRSSSSGRFEGALKDASFLCKIVELILCAIALGLVVDPFNDRMQPDRNRAAIIYVSFCSYVLINAVAVISRLLGDRWPKKASIMFSGLGAILSFTAGLILIHDWNNFQGNMISRYLQRYLDQMVASGVLGILATVAFVFDGYYVAKYK
ncbi:uncharacterized protein LOC105696234 [Orussus abietinus]|uniref:uncharacterized protein LOC105696234 n=1 Tax=Orussus abietinus TaxID=222816 RepID=UPI0006256EA3|nr:uncharacterized protein LOC105696234 [Orussus abietinus]